MGTWHEAGYCEICKKPFLSEDRIRAQMCVMEHCSGCNEGVGEMLTNKNDVKRILALLDLPVVYDEKNGIPKENYDFLEQEVFFIKKRTADFIIDELQRCDYLDELNRLRVVEIILRSLNKLGDGTE